MATLETINAGVETAKSDIQALISMLTALNDTYNHNVDLYNDFFDSTEMDILLSDGSSAPNLIKMINQILGTEAPNSAKLEGKTLSQVIADALVAIRAGVATELDTLAKVATSLGNDTDFAGSMSTALAGKLASDGIAVDSAKLQGKTKEEIKAEIVAYLVGTAPATLDTLEELADALGDDANFATNITTSISLKADKTYVDEQIADMDSKIARHFEINLL